MKKIPTIFIRDEKYRSLVINKINPECMWVFDGEGIATIKLDGTCCKIDKDGFWKRREVKKGKKEPKDFVLSEHDEITGRRFGWVPVDPRESGDKYHIEAYRENMIFGTYELIGPKINGNHEGADKHMLVRHDETQIVYIEDRSYAGIKNTLSGYDIEGVVFHHQDGRMAKIKKKDFGMKRR